MSGEKCDTCKHFGAVYWKGGLAPRHRCAKEVERRKAYAESNPRADFMDHFRLFFDAGVDDAACQRYERKEPQ